MACLAIILHSSINSRWKEKSKQVGRLTAKVNMLMLKFGYTFEHVYF